MGLIMSLLIFSLPLFCRRDSTGAAGLFTAAGAGAGAAGLAGAALTAPGEFWSYSLMISPVISISFEAPETPNFAGFFACLPFHAATCARAVPGERSHPKSGASANSATLAFYFSAPYCNCTIDPWS